MKKKYVFILFILLIMISQSLFAQPTNKIDSVGNIGAGVLNPLFRLQTNGALNAGDGPFILRLGAAATNFYDAYKDGSSAYFHTPAAMFRKDGGGTRIDQAPVSLVLYNADGSDGTWTKLAFANREVTGGGNTVSIAGIASQKISGISDSWAHGDLILWAKAGIEQKEILRASSNGNVGIGVTAPLYKLDVDGAVHSRAVAINTSLNRIPTSNEIALSTANGAGIQSAWLWRENYAYSNWGIFHDNTSDNVHFVGNNSSRLSIGLASGRIGIGTSEPNTLVHIHEEEENKDTYLHMTNINTGKQSADGLELSANRDLGANVWNYENGYLRFATGNSEQMRITSDGKIGIGTISPSEKLSVNGNVRAKKIIISQTGWPDYVFDSSYSLRSLSEVERFISKYKHLPDMPSVKEVEEKGISVGDNQAMLLKKIEELTLYIIQQGKEIEILKKKIEKK